MYTLDSLNQMIANDTAMKISGSQLASLQANWNDPKRPDLHRSKVVWCTGSVFAIPQAGIDIVQFKLAIP